MISVHVKFAGTYDFANSRQHGCTALRMKVQAWIVKGQEYPPRGVEIGVPPLNGGDCPDGAHFARVTRRRRRIFTSLNGFSETFSPSGMTEVARLEYEAIVTEKESELSVKYRVQLVYQGVIVEERSDNLIWKCKE